MSGLVQWSDTGQGTALRNLALARASYEAFDGGDLDRLLEGYDPDILWVEPAELPFGGTYHGRAGVRTYLQRVQGYFRELRLEPEMFLDDGDRVFAVGYAKGRTLRGEAVVIPFTHVLTYRGDLVVRFEDYTRPSKVLGFL